MRIALDPRARRLFARLPRTSVYTLLELVLLSLLAVQCARLAWTILTPVGPIGDWRPEASSRPAGGIGLLGSFDPFFRLSNQAGPVVVTSLNLTLHGIRQDEASGRGSAIIATPDGLQRSFAVGEEIVPGVTLTAVAFDSVTISRGGVAEQLFMDQSPPAQVVGPPGPRAAGQPGGTPSVEIPSLAVPAAPTSSLLEQISFTPRTNGNEVSGIIVSPQGSGDAFRAAGFAPGDVIVRVNGRRVDSAEEARSVAADLATRGASVQVEREGRVITLRMRSGQ